MARVCEDRARVWEAWQKFGPGTTEDVGVRAGWDWRSFRPRTTELVQLGFVALVGREGRAGVYVARTEAEALAAFQERQRSFVSGQLQLL